MGKALDRLYLPADTAYQRNSTIRRTVKPRRPIRMHQPLLLVDVQALPPPGWCEGCGMEIYREGALLCRQCAGEEDA